MGISCAELSIVAVTFDGATFLDGSMWPTVAHNQPAYQPRPLIPSSSLLRLRQVIIEPRYGGQRPIDPF